MKKLFMTMVCATFALALTAQEISFNETIHDFGDVTKGSDAVYEFTFTNSGQAPLVLTKCETTCGCTTPTCPTGKAFNPGESGTISVRYNRTDNPGAFNRTVTINSNAVATPKVGLTIRGTVK
jgi:hypothetical protein